MMLPVKHKRGKTMKSYLLCVCVHDNDNGGGDGDDDSESKQISNANIDFVIRKHNAATLSLKA